MIEVWGVERIAPNRDLRDVLVHVAFACRLGEAAMFATFFG